MKRRWIAIGLVFLLILPVNPLYGEASPKSKNPPSANEIKIPESMGSVRERYEAAKTPLVILVEEAHAEFDAETNIRLILDRLQKNYGLETVGVEAAFTELEPAFLRAFPDKAIMERTLVAFLKRGEISGVEMASILNEKDARYFGLEIPDLYDQDRDLFLKALENQPALEERLGRIRAHLVNLKRIVYSESLFTLDEKIEAFENSGMHLVPLLKELAEREEVQGKSLPQIIKFIQILHGAGRLEQDPVKPVAEKFVIAMKREIPERLRDDREGKKEFQSYLQAFSTERLPLTSFMAYLARKATSLGMDLTPYEVLKPYFEEPDLLQSIESQSFMAELETFLQEVKENELAGADEATRTLERLYRYLKILNQVAGLKADRKGFLEYASRRDAFQEAGFWDFIESKMPTVKRPEESIPLEELLKPARNFYEAALERERVMYPRMKQILKDSPNQFVAVSSGGFHTQGFADRLKEEGISFCIITPAIEKLSDPQIYLNAMREKSPFYVSQAPALGRFIALRRLMDPTSRNFRNFNFAVATRAYVQIPDGAGPIVAGWLRNLDRRFERLTDAEKKIFESWVVGVITATEGIPPVTDLAGFLEMVKASPRMQDLIRYLGELDAENRFREEVSPKEQGLVMKGLERALAKIRKDHPVNEEVSVFAVIDESNFPEDLDGLKALINNLGTEGHLKIYYQNPEFKESMMKWIPEAFFERMTWQLYKDQINKYEVKRDVEEAREAHLNYVLLFADPADVPEILIEEGTVPNTVFFDPATTRDFNWLRAEVLQIVPRMARMDPEVQASFIREISDLGFSRTERGKGAFIQFTLAVLVEHLIENREMYLALARAA